MSNIAPIPKDGALEPANADSIMAVISRAASDPSVDIQKYRDLIAMYKELRADEAKAVFAAAKVAAKKELLNVKVIRDAKNDHTKSSYTRLETLAAAIDPIIVKYGFDMSFGTDQSALPNHYGVTGRLLHENGHHEDYRADVPADLAGPQGKANKNPTQGFGSTLSYGRRYLKLLIFDIATREDDDGKAAGIGETVSEEQLAELQRLIMDADANLSKFLKVLNIEKIDELPAARYADAVDALNILKAKRGARKE